MGLSYRTDYGYANDRLRETFVRKDGRPVYVTQVFGDGQVEYREIGDTFNKRADIKTFDFSPLPLGYINLDIEVDYLQRLPARFYHQGIRNNVLVSKARRVRDLWTKSLVNCVMGVYPQFEDCVEAIYNGEAKEKAFARKFCIGVSQRGRHDFSIYYRGNAKVGTLDAKSLRYELGKDHMFLKESLEEEMNK